MKLIDQNIIEGKVPFTILHVELKNRFHFKIRLEIQISLLYLEFNHKAVYFQVL